MLPAAAIVLDAVGAFVNPATAFRSRDLLVPPMSVSCVGEIVFRPILGLYVSSIVTAAEWQGYSFSNLLFASAARVFSILFKKTDMSLQVGLFFS